MYMNSYSMYTYVYMYFHHYGVIDNIAMMVYMYVRAHDLQVCVEITAVCIPYSIPPPNTSWYGVPPPPIMEVCTCT